MTLEDLADLMVRGVSPLLTPGGTQAQEERQKVLRPFWFECVSGAVQLGVGNSTFASLKTNNTTDVIAAHPVIATAVIRRNLRVFILVKQ